MSSARINQPTAALEVLTALADYLAGRNSVLETQVEGWGSIDDDPKKEEVDLQAK